jgi:hypothetical protein
MAALFTQDYWLLWATVLGLALFFPVRRLLWVLYVRRARRRGGGDDAAEQLRLKRRATVTAILLCFIFSALYSAHLFKGQP